jgi:heptosyltransferase-2
MPKLYELHTYSSIAIVQTAFIGDVALMLYTAQALRELHPSVRLGVLTTPAAAPLVRCAAAVDDVMEFDKRKSQRGLRGIYAVARQLSRYECILSAHRSLRSALVVALARPRLSVGFNVAAGAWLYKQRVVYRREQHEAERLMALLDVFNGKHSVDYPIWQPFVPPRLVFSAETEKRVQLLLCQALIEKPFVAVAPGSVWATKQWREEHYIAAIQTLHTRGIQAVLVGSTADVQLCSRIAAATGAPMLAGATTLPDMLVLLRSARALISGDSAPVHLANLVGCPVVAIFGPTAPSFGFAPRGASDIVLENTHLDCRPCSPHGTHMCPLGTHECMWSVAPNSVVEAVEQILTLS